MNIKQKQTSKSLEVQGQNLSNHAKLKRDNETTNRAADNCNRDTVISTSSFTPKRRLKRIAMALRKVPKSSLAIAPWPKLSRNQDTLDIYGYLRYLWSNVDFSAPSASASAHYHQLNRQLFTAFYDPNLYKLSILGQASIEMYLFPSICQAESDAIVCARMEASSRA